MDKFMIKPTTLLYQTCKEFAADMNLCENDLIITNEYIYDPNFKNLNLKCATMFQEKYGAGEPSDEMVEHMYRDMPKNVKRIIAIGGGTVLDISKLFALKKPSPVLELFDGKLPYEKDKELILVPTTCGTGSEVTNVSVLALISRNTKKGLAVDELYGDTAILIPELLKSLPFKVFATSSIDALTHAVESCLSPKANEATRMFSYRAIEKILKGYLIIRDKGPEARAGLMEDFLLASNYAGIAFGNAGCAAVHALSYPLGAKYHVPHGESNYAMFTGVMNCYMTIKSDGEIATMNTFIAGLLDCKVKDVYVELEKLLNIVLPKKALHEYGVNQEDLREFTSSVMVNQGRLMANNFVVLDADAVYGIYQTLF
ncbi:4-hydroxybutyrate dehydrogenase [Megasphaera cerevisiae DSM 20462]|jgi:4-hydroxybutyrate dehydrogenase|uniref:4-hydroxybutyrate dehydrogenase n=1 Tax=Megasphaera cerevisiae DSM 20462 TaxID=1122219 RepID=A0A0J6ZM33_9FIRM|nr:4-hydroxybutyrate dehydrogenase [Megasphaera cerevisiae]KMO85946.1 4-hydroxybutyrate dehydrogenase [Megasphaera cerevisiae DSM 20462]MCI1750037.1 4-hydroxybutyrate dehydrogenase [Megasphaera cerevisiae]OKY53620.1 4-hydroxybutyrate dehydrogenase [Megasphaera cerevisiae]SJZ98834.1 4-hydroxybutyrate dehydrogenase [Megasphaera cerevisiae DSM 20462]